MADPRVDERVSEVREQDPDLGHDPDEQRRRHDDVEVAPEKALEGVLAHAGNVEDRLHDDRAADEDRQKYDEANLRAKLAKYLPQPFELRTAVHTINDCTFVIIRIPPRPDGFCVFAADGTHEKNGKEVFVFRKGEVFARHGTATG